MSNTSNLKAFFKGSAVLVLSNVSLKAINFFLLRLYTDHLTPQMLGVSDTVTSFTGLLFPILVMGLDSAYSAFYFEKEEQDRSRKVYSTIIAVLTVIGVLPLLACIFSKDLATMLFGNSNNYMVMVLALISVTLNLWYLPFTLEIRMQNRMTVYGVITVISSLIMILLNIYFVSVLKLGVYALILSTVIVHLLQLILFAACAKARFSFAFIDGALLKKMLRFSLPLVPTVVATWILNLSDRYVILHYLGEDAVGIYGIGGRFITLVNMIVSGVTMAYTTFAYSNVDNPDAKKQYATVLNLMYVLLIGIAFVISIFSREIIQIMTSEAYASAYEPIRDMMFAQVVYAISTITSYGIFFKKKPGYALLSTTLAAVVNLILNCLLIPQYGIAAAAATTLVGYLIMFLINYVVSQKLYPCDYGIKKIGLNMAALYIVVILCTDGALMVRIVITVICAAVTLLMFRKQLKEIFLMIKR